MTSLEGRVALVAGGAGAVGEGAVEALLAAGAVVAVPSRSRARVDELRERLGAGDHLVGLVADVGDQGGAASVRRRIIGDHGGIDIVVASVGGWWSGPPLVDVGLDVWRRYLESAVTPHLVLAQTFLPMVRERPGGVYAMVVGDTDVAPVPGASLTTVIASAVMGIYRSLDAENAAGAARLLALHLGPVATRKVSRPDPSWYTAREIGEQVARVASDPSAPGGVLELRSKAAG